MLFLVLSLSNFLDDLERKVHRLVVHEDNVVEIHVVVEPLLDVGVEEPDLEHSLRILNPIRHVEVAETVAKKDDVVPRLQDLEVVGIVNGVFVLVVDVNDFAVEPGDVPVVVVGQEVGDDLQVGMMSSFGLQDLDDQITNSGGEYENGDSGVEKVAQHLVGSFSEVDVGSLDHVGKVALVNAGPLQGEICLSVPLNHVRNLFFDAHVRVVLDGEVVSLDGATLFGVVF